jgi:hypothetical protein
VGESRHGGGESGQLATIAASGPLFSLAVGILFWFVYRRFPRRPSGLLYLMLSMVGIYSFLGPLVGASLGGDFNTASRFLGLPDAVRYAGTAAGLILLPVFMFRMGTELLRWAPREFGRVAATACVALAPWVVGTALTLAIYWPLPAALVSSTLTGSAFWAFAALGAACTFSPARLGDEPSGITRSDLIVAVIAFAGVRLLVNGIRLAH